MQPSNKIIFCKNCQCRTKPCWSEPSHHLYSALTLGLIATGVTFTTASLMGLIWLQRLVSTGRWACPHCHKESTPGFGLGPSRR